MNRPAPAQTGRPSPSGPCAGGHQHYHVASRPAVPMDGFGSETENLDYASSKEEGHQPSAEAERAAARDLDLWLPRNFDMEQLTLQVRSRRQLQDMQHIMNGTRTMADIIFDHQGRRHSPPPPLSTPASGAMWPHGLWRTWGPIPKTTKTDYTGGGTTGRPAAFEGPDQAPRLGDPDPRSPRAGQPGQDHGTPAPTVPDDPGTPETSGTHQPLAKPIRASPPANGPPYIPQRSPLQPLAHPRPDCSGPHTPGMEAGPRSTRTPAQCRGTRGATHPKPKSHPALCGATSDPPR